LAYLFVALTLNLEANSFVVWKYRSDQDMLKSQSCSIINILAVISLV